MELRSTPDFVNKGLMTQSRCELFRRDFVMAIGTNERWCQQRARLCSAYWVERPPDCFGIHLVGSCTQHYAELTQ